MPLILRVEPEAEFHCWEEFKKHTPPYSIALDGYLSLPPMFDHSGPWANFNHHEGVDRTATRATCAQVLIEIRQRLFKTFNLSGKPHAIAYVNDCDEDVCMSWFLLKNHEISTNILNPRLNRLVYVVDMLDTTAGAYPYPPNFNFLKELAWMVEPYRKFRNSGEIDQRDALRYTEIIQEVNIRMWEHIHGKGKSIELDFRYDVLGQGDDWILVEEHGAQARTKMFSEGIDAFVSVRKRDDGKWIYTFGKMSRNIPTFDLPLLYKVINEIEGADIAGGGNTIGGVGRMNGCSIPPEDMIKVVNEHKTYFDKKENT